MNCRQGDLAVVIRTDTDETRDNIGAIVMCARRYDNSDGLPAWVVESQGRGLIGWSARGLTADWRVVVRDRNLRPIRGEPERDVDEICELAPQQLEGVACWPT